MKKKLASFGILLFLVFGMVVLCPFQEEVWAKGFSLDCVKGPYYLPVGNFGHLTLRYYYATDEDEFFEEPVSSDSSVVQIVKKTLPYSDSKGYYVKGVSEGKATISFKNKKGEIEKIDITVIPELDLNIRSITTVEHKGYYAKKIVLKNNSAKSVVIEMGNFPTIDGQGMVYLENGKVKIGAGKTGTIWYTSNLPVKTTTATALKNYKYWPQSYTFAVKYCNTHFFYEYSKKGVLRSTDFVGDAIKEYYW